MMPHPEREVPALHSGPVGQPLVLPPPPALQPSDSLFLDFDGTLAEIAPRPDLVQLPPGMAEAIGRARAHVEGRLAVLSGRPVSFLHRLLNLPGLAMAGIHGLERRLPDGSTTHPLPHPGLEPARLALEELAARHPGLLLEDKGLSIGLHTRLAPELHDMAREASLLLAQAHGLTIQTGKMVFELRPPGADKGDALNAFQAAPPFAGHRPVFVGDDDTDEVAFAAAAAHGGHGIRVGACAGDTSAAYGLRDVAAVGRWLVGAA